MEYRIVAIECTGTIFKELQILKFSELYEIIFPVIKKKSEEEIEEEKSEDKPSLELQHAVIESLGKAWPLNDAPSQNFSCVLL